VEEIARKVRALIIKFVPLFLLLPFMDNKPTLHTSLSPALLHLYEVNNSIVVIIDVFRPHPLLPQHYIMELSV
jgi:hypothetical protein